MHDSLPDRVLRRQCSAPALIHKGMPNGGVPGFEAPERVSQRGFFVASGLDGLREAVAPARLTRLGRFDLI